MARDLYWLLLALVIAGGLAAPTAVEPEVHHLRTLGEIEATGVIELPLYKHEGACRYLGCETLET